MLPSYGVVSSLNNCFGIGIICALGSLSVAVKVDQIKHDTIEIEGLIKYTINPSELVQLIVIGSDD